MADLTVIIPTIPEREALFAQALASVKAQTEPCEYITAVDAQHHGPVATVNSLGACVATEWLFRLDDDDLLDPDHVKVLSHWLTDDADIVYTWCRVEGEGHAERQWQVQWQAEICVEDDGPDWGGSWDALHEHNWIPCSAAIRTDLWHDLGGLRDVDEEDWDFWKRALDAGATFKLIPAVTWTYRLNPEWEHRSDEIRSAANV